MNEAILRISFIPYDRDECLLHHISGTGGVNFPVGDYIKFERWNTCLSLVAAVTRIRMSPFGCAHLRVASGQDSPVMVLGNSVQLPLLICELSDHHVRLCSCLTIFPQLGHDGWGLPWQTGNAASAAKEIEGETLWYMSRRQQSVAFKHGQAVKIERRILCLMSDASALPWRFESSRMASSSWCRSFGRLVHVLVLSFNRLLFISIQLIWAAAVGTRRRRARSRDDELLYLPR